MGNGARCPDTKGVNAMNTIYLATIFDMADFGKTLHRKAFANRNTAQGWASEYVKIYGERDPEFAASYTYYITEIDFLG